MEIVIHGTKRGVKTFTPNKISGLLDVTCNSPNPSSIGKEAYAIRFIDNYTIFAKYKIIRDVLGDKRTGFVAFSLFVPRSKKLQGEYIINLLDEVSKEFTQKNIKDNNLENIDENWEFIKIYKTEIKSIDEHILSGIEDDAYIYYKNREYLERYFNAPFQDEYKPYRQIYFVNENDSGKSDNPLNALRHNPNANLTEKNILYNPSYKLLDYSHLEIDGVEIKIRSHGILLNPSNEIFKKDTLTIKFTKKYTNDVPIIEGKLSDSSINQYLRIKDDSSLIVDKIPNFEWSKKEVEIIIEDRKGKRINDAKITFKNDKSITLKSVNQNKIIFTGKEQGEKWIICVEKKGSVAEQKVIPENNLSSIKFTLYPTNKYRKKRPHIKILLISSIACVLVFGVYFMVGMFWGDSSTNDIAQQTITDKPLPKLTTAEIESYVEGDSLYLAKLEKYKNDWALLKDSTDSTDYKKYEVYIDKAIKKREAIIKGDYAFFTDSNVKYSNKQLPLKNAVLKVKPEQYEQVKSSLGDVSVLTLTQVADSMNKILAQLNETESSTVSNNKETKNVDTTQLANKTTKEANSQTTSDAVSNEETEIINYLKGNELKGAKLKEFQGRTEISGKLKKSISLALEFWNLDGSSEKGNNKTYHTYKSKVKIDENLKNNTTLKEFLEKATNETKYPKEEPGAGNTLTLKQFINKAK